MASSRPPPPTYSPTGAQKALERRQQELEKKAEEIAEREAQLSSSQLSSSGHEKNWPPVPVRCCFGPCFYQDISVDIPAAYQTTVRMMYGLWMFYIFLLFLNMIGSMALFIADDEGTTFGVSLLILFLFVPMSYVCWFRPIYNAFKSDSSFNFMVFFFIFFFQFVVAVFYAVGIPNMGSCGLLNGITTLSKHSDSVTSTYTVGIMAILIGFLWAIEAMISFIMLVKIHHIYRGSGASLAKAQEELATGVMSSSRSQRESPVPENEPPPPQRPLPPAAAGLRY